MATSTEYLIGGVLCLIIAIVYSVITKKISAGTIAALGLFAFGVYKALTAK